MILKFCSPLLVFMSIFYSLVGYAHDADKAYFKIEKEATNTVVYAEFPWGLRKAIDNFQMVGASKPDLQLKLFKYLEENLILENQEGVKLPIIDVQLFKKPNEGHHSTINYKITFKGKKLFRVTNTVMCDYFKNQLNYHTLYEQSDFKITSAENSSFLVKKTSSESSLKYYAGALLLCVLVFSLFKVIKRS